MEINLYILQLLDNLHFRHLRKIIRRRSTVIRIQKNHRLRLLLPIPIHEKEKPPHSKMIPEK